MRRKKERIEKRRKRKRGRKRQSSKKESFLCPLLFSDTDNERKRQTEWTKLGKVLRGGVQSVQLCLLADTQKTVLDSKRSYSKNGVAHCTTAVYNNNSTSTSSSTSIRFIMIKFVKEKSCLLGWWNSAVCHCQPDHTTAVYLQQQRQKQQEQKRGEENRT